MAKFETIEEFEFEEVSAHLVIKTEYRMVCDTCDYALEIVDSRSEAGTVFYNHVQAVHPEKETS